MTTLRWQDSAACIGADTAIFFPESGDPVGPAKALCHCLPVRSSVRRRPRAQRSTRVWAASPRSGASTAASTGSSGSPADSPSRSTTAPTAATAHRRAASNRATRVPGRTSATSEPAAKAGTPHEHLTARPSPKGRTANSSTVSAPPSWPPLGKPKARPRPGQRRRHQPAIDRRNEPMTTMAEYEEAVANGDTICQWLPQEPARAEPPRPGSFRTTRASATTAGTSARARSTRSHPSTATRRADPVRKARARHDRAQVDAVVTIYHGTSGWTWAGQRR